RGRFLLLIDAGGAAEVAVQPAALHRVFLQLEGLAGVLRDALRLAADVALREYVGDLEVDSRLLRRLGVLLEQLQAALLHLIKRSGVSIAQGVHRQQLAMQRMRQSGLLRRSGG